MELFGIDGHRRAKASVAARMHAALCLAMALLLTTWAVPLTSAYADEASSSSKAAASQHDVAGIVAQMTLDQKISQLIIPAMRTWDGTNVTNLADVPDLAAALQAHNYGGVILFAVNVAEAGQIARLTSDLQTNNAKTSSIPYFMCVDGEGGVVTRLTTGTRMTGSMAIGATGSAASDNARATGKVIGEELAAAGFNVDFAPDIDVNSNPANPVIGTRSFSDDAQTVATLGYAFAQGLAESNVIATYKHFPGHGDTGSDTHMDTASVDKTYDELKATEFIPFQNAIDNGADIIMTAHVTLPKVDDQVTFTDGAQGYFPATMSAKMLTGILRGDLGFNGVVVTDALEMDALYKANLVEGERGSVTYAANMAVKIIEAGGDILLVPVDLKNADAVAFMDAYIAALATYAEANPEFMARIDESVTRVLSLKDKYGILSMDAANGDAEQKAAVAESVIGSSGHRAIEQGIAQQAITLLKNEGGVLPLSGKKGNIVIFGRDSNHVKTIAYAISLMQLEGLIDADAHVVNLSTGSSTGSSSSEMQITLGNYRDTPSGGNPTFRYTDEMKRAIEAADTVIACSVTFNLTALQPTSDQYQGVSTIMADAQASGARFVLLSCNLPYDAARYQDADAIMCCYMSAGLDSDPTERGADNPGAYNANVVCALESMFAAADPAGTLPVNVPALTSASDGTVSYSDTVLYARGTGLQGYASASGKDAAQGAQGKSGAAEQPAKADSGNTIPVAAIVIGAIVLIAAIALIVRARRRSQKE